MMSKRKPKQKPERRQHAPEFRVQALALADKIGVAAAARELDLHESQIYGWRSKAKAERSTSDLEKQQAVEIAKLKRQLADQDEELAIVKKLQHISLRNYEDAASAKYGFMHNHRDFFTVSAMIRVLDVSRSGFYAWQRRQAIGNGRDAANEALDAQVLKAFESRKGRSGSPGLVLDLADAGCVRNRKTIAKSMKRQGLRAKAARKFKVTTDSTHDKPVAANLLNQDFSAAAPNAKWVGDITYLWTDQGWLYLAVVIDLYSRKVIGWSMSERMTATLVCDALMMALWRRHFPKDVIMHTDRGSQYCSDAHQSLLRKHQLVCSMSGVGNCYDNAVAESFFHTLKVEAIHGERFYERSKMQHAVFEYIEVDYNRKRRHSSVGMISPEAFEAQNLA
jgi:transposase InsO family protein/transposase-like protein